MGFDKLVAFALAATLVLLAVNLGVVYTASTGLAKAKLVAGSFTVLVAFISVLALLHMRSFLLRLNKAWSRPALLLATGAVFWGMAESAWLYYDVTQGVPGFSVADILWLLGYAFLLAGFVDANIKLKASFRKRDLLLSAAVAVFSLTVIISVILPVALSASSSMAALFNIFYLVFDLAIIILAIRLASNFMGSRLGFAWSVLLTGFAAIAVADIWYAWLYLTSSYFEGHVLDFIYNSGYILVASGAVLFEALSRSGFRFDEAKEPEAKPNRIESILLKKDLEQAVSLITDRDPLAVDMDVLSFLSTKKGWSGVFVCLDRPHSFIESKMKSSGIDPGKVHVITIGGAPSQKQNVSFIQSPEDLTSIKIDITEAIGNLPKKTGKSFLLMDCVLTLSLYQDLNTLGKFLHDLNMAMREKSVYQVQVLGRGGAINAFVMRFCDTNESLA